MKARVHPKRRGCLPMVDITPKRNTGSNVAQDDLPYVAIIDGTPEEISSVLAFAGTRPHTKVTIGNGLLGMQKQAVEFNSVDEIVAFARKLHSENGLEVTMLAMNLGEVDIDAMKRTVELSGQSSGSSLQRF